ncbi:hypothetical protein ACFVVM_14115 [Nocardia sp. NPDC058176]|uniref:hypothetical protein n=1 Tax=Nocardia sp. NPDC058176 TaxID=3346368 RepID=UPI0036DB5A95
MTGAAGVVALVLLWVGYLHRTRKITWLGRFADRVGGLVNMPGWVGLPILIFIGTILTAFLGFIWDVSLHIGDGRDEGPLANPAHYFILVGLFFLFTGGMAAVVLPLDEKPGPAAVRITRTWYAPVSGILIAGAGLYALIGFPLDDIWHRLFGQDVTLWGPTHLMLIGGAGLSLIAIALLWFEGSRNPVDPDHTNGPAIWWLRCFIFGGLIIGMSVFQVEFDFGVAQFSLLFQPLLIVIAATITLVAARSVLGPFSTIVVVLFAAAVRTLTAWLVSVPFEAPYNVFPFYLGAAVVVELLALLPLARRPILWGALAGLGIATVGLWLESLWVEAMFVDPWPTALWPELLLTCVPVGIAGGVVGALLGIVLRGEKLPRPPIRRGIMVASVLIVSAAVANGLMVTVPENATATVTLTEAEPVPGGRMVDADIRLSPDDLVSGDPEWVQILAWQGGADTQTPGRGLIVDQLERVGEGHYRSTTPVPAHGTWKTVLRVHDGRTLTALPIFMPADPGIGATEVAAPAEFTRPFVAEITVLQRERNFDHPDWLFAAASLVVLVCSLILIWALSWGAARINERYPTTPPAATPEPTSTP